MLDSNAGERNTEDRAKELEREYLREWRKRNKEKMREYRANYWRKKAEEEGRVSKDG